MAEKTDMVLLVDMGNTSIRWGWLDKAQVRPGQETLPALQDPGSALHRAHALEELLDECWSGLPVPDQVWLASVAPDELSRAVTTWIDRQWACKTHQATSQSESDGVCNAYTEPQRLGVDRWLSLLATRRHTDKPCCVIDCGSAITFDVLMSSGQHRGGHILPGLQMMRDTLYQQASGVTFTRAADDTLTLFTSNTEDAVAAGSLYAVVAYIERVVNDLEQELAETTKCLITGGDAGTLQSLVSIDVEFCPNLVLQGLAVYGQQAGWL